MLFLLISKTSGVANVLVTNPLWVVNSRIKMQGIHKVGNGSPNQSELSRRKYKGLIGKNLVNFDIQLFYYQLFKNDED